MKHIKIYDDFMTIIKEFNINDIIYNKHGFFIKDKVWLEPGEKFIVTDKDKHFYTIKYLKTNDTITHSIICLSCQDFLSPLSPFDDGGLAMESRMEVSA